MFGLKLSKVSNDDSSEIMFGGYNENLIGDEGISWQSNYGDGKWLVSINKFSFNDEEIHLTSNLFEIATAENHLRMARTDFVRIEMLFRSKYECTYDASFLFYCYTDSRSLTGIPPIVINLDKITLVVPASDYVEFVPIMLSYF